MSVSKLTLYGIGTALFRTLPTRRTVSRFSLFSHYHHRRRRSLSSSAAAATETLSSVDQHHHPWPEWVSFVDTLNTKGYLTITTKPSSSDDDDGSAYVNINLLKDACLSFARDRYDLLKSLPLKDIQGVVEGGCPNLLRKAVNSAKRLRVHVRLDEGDVCSACNLRDSCDRAYVILKEFEADARTVDIVRILLFYALDPLVLSGGEKPPGREVIESSARNLLSQLIELSESSPAPAPAPAFTPVRPKPTAPDAVAKGQPLNFMTNKLSNDVEMKKGDWMCPKCNFMNFSRNMQCLGCNEDKPKDINQSTVEMKKGDWICPECSFLNFYRNIRCLKCKTEGPPKMVNTDEVERKKGDWMCPKCNFMNFSRNMQCLSCNEDKPKDINQPTVEMKKGDWICPECSFLNFSRNTCCLKCKTEGPPKMVNTDEVEKKKGDWTCPQCGFMNYASNTKCLRCPETRPKKHPGDWSCPKCEFMNFASKVKCLRCREPNPSPKKHPGDWSCPKCDFYNYARNMACLKCNTERTKDQPTGEYEEHIWKR